MPGAIWAPKPIQTVATLHSIYVIKAALETFMLHVHMYSGTEDKNTKKITKSVGVKKVFINLLEIFLEKYTGLGCSATMDLAHMGKFWCRL